MTIIAPSAKAERRWAKRRKWYTAACPGSGPVPELHPLDHVRLLAPAFDRPELVAALVLVAAPAPEAVVVSARLEDVVVGERTRPLARPFTRRSATGSWPGRRRLLEAPAEAVGPASGGGGERGGEEALWSAMGEPTGSAGCENDGGRDAADLPRRRLIVSTRASALR